MLTAYYPSPIGQLQITGDYENVFSVKFVEEDIDGSRQIDGTEVSKCIEQLQLYFSGALQVFDLNLKLSGTAFQQQVWKEVMKVPIGKTSSYLDISKNLGDKNKTRAVGNANGLNNLLIIIPCHRIIGADGSLTGYAGGLEKKKWLLDFEDQLTSGQTKLDLG